LIEIGIIKYRTRFGSGTSAFGSQSPGGPEANCNRAGDGRNQVRIGSAVLWPSKFLLVLSPETPVPLPQNIEKRTAVGSVAVVRYMEIIAIKRSFE
jgi:hypothetical protein